MTRKRLFIPALSLLFLLLLVASGGGAELKKEDRTAEIVSSVVKAYGGADALEKIVSVTAKGRISEFVSGKAGDYLRYFQKPGKLRVEIMPEKGGEVRVLKRGHAWQASGGEFSELSPLELQSMLYQYSCLNLPMALANGSYHAEYVDREKMNGTKAFLLLIEPKSSPRLAVLVDAKSRLVVRVDASFPTGAVGTAELSTEFADFRPVAGVQFPHKITSYAGGIVLSETVLDTIVVNEKIPPALFAPQEEQKNK